LREVLAARQHLVQSARGKRLTPEEGIKRQGSIRIIIFEQRVEINRRDFSIIRTQNGSFLEIVP
jgi:hypothetical protein